MLFLALVVLLVFVFGMTIGYVMGSKERPKSTKRERALELLIFRIRQICLMNGDVNTALTMDIDAEINKFLDKEISR